MSGTLISDHRDSRFKTKQDDLAHFSCPRKHTANRKLDRYVANIDRRFMNKSLEIVKSKKSRQACLRCTIRKAKCSENRPCDSCYRNGKVCEDVGTATKVSLSRICHKLQSAIKTTEGTDTDSCLFFIPEIFSYISLSVKRRKSLELSSVKVQEKIQSCTHIF